MNQFKFFLCLVAYCIASLSYAYDIEVDDIYYNVNVTEMTVDVTYKSVAYNSYSGRLFIPSTITYNNRELKVVSIGSNAFRDCDKLTSVSLPNSISLIGNGAFYGCTNLTDLIIPNSVTTIKDNAFNGCSSLTNMDIPNSVTDFRHSAFYNCTNLRSVRLSENMTEIDLNFFHNCKELVSIDIPASVKRIGYNAFRNCTKLKSINLVDGLETLGIGVFIGCSSLKEITIPSTVMDIYGSCFYHANLQSVTFDDSPNSININSNASVNGVPDYHTFDLNPIKNIYFGRPISLPDGSGIGTIIPLDNLSKVSFGENISYLNYRIFNGSECTILKEIYCYSSNPPSVGSFSNKAYINCNVYVPVGALSFYQNDTNWKKFWNIQETDFSSGIEDIIVDLTSNIEVYDLSGRFVCSGDADILSTLSKGLWIVRCNGQSKKIIIK